MTWLGVPWAIGGGAKLPPEVLRLVSDLAAGGHNGIIRPQDCAVRELDVPDNRVQVMPGSAAVVNNATNAFSQMYAAMNPDVDLVPITATTSAGARTDLLYVSVEDPQYPGAPVPASVKDGPYVHSRVIENVDPNTTYEDFFTMTDGDGNPYTGEPLALIDMPVSTATVIQDYIRDIRKLASPRRLDIKQMQNLRSGEVGDQLSTSGFSQFPKSTTAEWNGWIPPWAVRMQGVARMQGIRAYGTNGQDVWGVFRLKVGEYQSQTTEFNETIGDNRETFGTECVWDWYVPEDHRGTNRNILVQGRQDGGAGSVESTWGTVVVIEITFFEDPDSQYWAAP